MTQRGGTMDYNQFLGSMGMQDSEDSKNKYDKFTGVKKDDNVQKVLGPPSRMGNGMSTNPATYAKELEAQRAAEAALTPIEIEEPVVDGPTEEERLALEAENLYNQKMGFWDSLSGKKEALAAAGIPMSDKIAADATPEEIDTLIKENPRWWSEYQESGDTSNPDAVVEEPTVEEPTVEEQVDGSEELDENGIPVELSDAPTDEINPPETVIETPEDAIIEEAIPSKWKNKDGSINWKFIGGVAATAGISIAKVLENSIMSYAAAKQGRVMDQSESSIGRDMIEDVKNKDAARQATFADKLAEIDAAAVKIAQEYENQRVKASEIFEIDRDADAHKNRLEEIGKQEEAATQRLYAAASIQTEQNKKLGLGGGPLGWEKE